MTPLLQAPVLGQSEAEPSGSARLGCHSSLLVTTPRKWCWLEDDKPHVWVRGTLAVPPKTHLGSSPQFLH